MMEKFEYYNVIRQLNDENVIFDDIMYRKKSYTKSPICFFLQGVRKLVNFIHYNL
jgi:hypothetical protein